MKRTSQRSIAHRLTSMNMLVSATALLLACAAFVTYDWVTFRASIVRNLSTQAQIIGANSTSALLFDDPESAETTLSALAAIPAIVSANIYRPEGARFAAYGGDPGTPGVNLPVVPKGAMEAHWFQDGQILLARRITSQGDTVGIAYLQSNLSEEYARLRSYGEIVGVVLLMSLLAALVVSWMARSAIAAPIMQLAETARMVARDQNYSVRVETGAASEEDAQLIESFNVMLAQIQERDAKLQKAREELEQRVKERTAELEAANKELESFSYSVSHDLRAPLRSIDGFSQALMEEYTDRLDDAGKDYLQRARAATQRMSVLIDDLLNLARVARMEMNRASVNLTAVAQGVRDDLEESQPGRRVDWVIREGMTVNGDAHLLRVVLQNLMGNAWKYTSAHPQARIEFGCNHDNGSKVFFVRDDGAGFDPAYSSRLFAAFQRLHSPKEFPGSGIGLATVQRIVFRHGGKIWAEGAVERGATFYFTL